MMTEKKPLFLFSALVLVLLAMLLLWRGEAAKNGGLRLTAEDVTAESLTLAAERGNVGTGKLWIDRGFFLWHREGLKWALLEPRQNAGSHWVLEANSVSLLPGKACRIGIPFGEIYGALPPGRYRIGKQVVFWGKTGEETRLITVPFQVR